MFRIISSVFGLFGFISNAITFCLGNQLGKQLETRTLDKVRTEMSFHVLAYSLKRMIRIFGVGPLMAAIRA
jgi:hypothetical protein